MAATAAATAVETAAAPAATVTNVAAAASADDDSIVPPVLTGKEVPYLDQTISFRGNEVFDQYGCAVMMNWENDVMVRASTVRNAWSRFTIDYHTHVHLLMHADNISNTRNAHTNLLMQLDSKRSIFDGQNSLGPTIEYCLSECGIWHGLN